MSGQFLREGFGWGAVLWLFGYVLGFVLFAFVPVSAIGWFITPVATVVTLWVLLKKLKANSLTYYFLIGVVWTIIAIVGDYLFIVLLLKPADGYYKFDVYLYYVLTFALPIIVGWWKNARTPQ